MFGCNIHNIRTAHVTNRKHASSDGRPAFTTTSLAVETDSLERKGVEHYDITLYPNANANMRLHVQDLPDEREPLEFPAACCAIGKAEGIAPSDLDAEYQKEWLAGNDHSWMQQIVAAYLRDLTPFEQSVQLQLASADMLDLPLGRLDPTLFDDPEGLAHTKFYLGLRVTEKFCDSLD